MSTQQLCVILKLYITSNHPAYMQVYNLITMKRIKPYLFTLLSLFLTSTVFLSCSDENIETNDLNANQVTSESQTIENPKEVIDINPYSLKENLNKFSVEYLNISNKISVIFKENKKGVFDVSLKLKISSCKSENELFTVLKNSNIKNYPALISLLKKQKQLCFNFALQNKSFSKINQEQRKIMMIDAFLANKKLSKDSKVMSKTAGGDCLVTYQDDMGNVFVDHLYNLAQILTAAGGAVVYSGGTLSPEVAGITIIAVTIEELYFNYQVGEVIDDYERCVSSNCTSKVKSLKY